MFISKLVLCLSAFISEPDARLLEQASWDQGFGTYFYEMGEAAKPYCAATFYRGEADTAGVERLTFDDSMALTHERAEDLVRSWAARL